MHHPNKMLRSALSALLALSMGVSLVHAPQPALADDGLTQPGGLTPDGVGRVAPGPGLGAARPSPGQVCQPQVQVGGGRPLGGGCAVPCRGCGNLG